MNNLNRILKERLCTGCGTCAGLCPHNAIKMEIDREKGIYIPVLSNKCNNCGICINVCPGREVDFIGLNKEIFGKQPENHLIGCYEDCYVGYSLNKKLRCNATSGGMITQILLYLLDKKIIDGALVVRMKKDNPLEPEPFIARTRDEIIDAKGSKYCPVPLNIKLEEIIRSKDEKFAVVGLPCQIQGIRKAQSLNKKLKNKIILTLGLFCNHTPNYKGTKLLLKKLGLKEKGLVKLNYRGPGWPGKMEISHQTRNIKLKNYWDFIGSGFFIPSRCITCNDCICELSDISFGDAWLPELSNDKVGSSIVISKNQFSEELLNKMINEDKVKLKKINIERVIESQSSILYLKKNINPNNKLFKNKPKYNPHIILKLGIIDNLIVLFIYLNFYIGSKSLLRSIICNIPFKIINLYKLFYMVILMRKSKELKKYL